MKNFLLNFIVSLIGRKPTSTDLIVASLNATVSQLEQHSSNSQAQADDHAAEITAMTAKHAELMDEALKAAQVAANIGALLRK